MKKESVHHFLRLFLVFQVCVLLITLVYWFHVSSQVPQIMDLDRAQEVIEASFPHLEEDVQKMDRELRVFEMRTASLLRLFAEYERPLRETLRKKAVEVSAKPMGERPDASTEVVKKLSESAAVKQALLAQMSDVNVYQNQVKENMRRLSVWWPCVKQGQCTEDLQRFAALHLVTQDMMATVHTMHAGMLLAEVQASDFLFDRGFSLPAVEGLTSK